VFCGLPREEAVARAAGTEVMAAELLFEVLLPVHRATAAAKWSGSTQFDKPGRNSYHISMKTVVSEKGQVTIPKELRLRLGIRTGQVLELTEEAGHILVAKADEADPAERLYGILPAKPGTDALITSMRGEPDAV
jgi:antitoxin PrlF